jgi:thiamine-phosphate pyrophosphorylase
LLKLIRLAEKAIAEGATYVAFGAVYATQLNQKQAMLELKSLNRQQQKMMPICAIGGLTVENSQVVIEAGADLCAVISDILGRSTAEIPARVQAWAQLFS